MMLDERMEDYFEITVKSILKSLSEANNTNNTEIYYYGSKVKYGFNLNKGATDKELRNFETKIGYKIPSDYKEFLQYTNGLEFKMMMLKFWILRRYLNVTKSLIIQSI